MRKKHIPVLLQEVIHGLEPKSNQIYVDATLGFGGHTEAILKKTSPNGLVYGIDQDQDALEDSKINLSAFDKRFIPVRGNFAQIDTLLGNICVTGGILADIGVSSYQLDEAIRGFSFSKSGPLDMRMDKEADLTASKIVNEWPEDQLKKVIKDYGEERFASRIASHIVAIRQAKYIETTSELAEIVSRAIPRKFWPKTIHPATKTFQGIRIAVNRELEVLTEFIPAAFKLLAPGARLGIITFHSLEDRIVKESFGKLVSPCICPPEFPKCVCNEKSQAIFPGKRFYLAGEREIKENPRSRSAKLRIIQKI